MGISVRATQKGSKVSKSEKEKVHYNNHLVVLSTIFKYNMKYFKDFNVTVFDFIKSIKELLYIHTHSTLKMKPQFIMCIKIRCIFPSLLSLLLWY